METILVLAVLVIFCHFEGGSSESKLPDVLIMDDNSREILFLDLYKRVSALEARVRMSDAIDWTQQAQFDTLKALAENQQNWLNELDAMLKPKGQCEDSKPTGKAAFSARLTHDMDDIKTHQVIIFDAVILNEGGFYNATTGIFQCPWNGVYDFSFFLGQRSENTDAKGAYVELYVNEKPIYTGVADQQHSKQDLQGGNRAIIRLKAGNQVKVVALAGSNHIEGDNHRSTTFSGLFLFG